MNVKIVIGANYGDEGKGLVSGCLAREAKANGEKSLTVFYNGTCQRAHTFENEVHRCMAAGTSYGSDTFYHRQFVIDPISIFLFQAKPIIDGECRVILPCDVVRNRKLETERGPERHGSCGFGLFEAVKRCKMDPDNAVKAKDLLDAWSLYDKLRRIEQRYGEFSDDLYNMHYFMLAADYIRKNCTIKSFTDTVKGYDTVIFEGGQGLLLDQGNRDCFPHLTPSSTGNTLIADDVKSLGVVPELFYVSRSYITRHGNGPMESECGKNEINPAIVDKTNITNEFQGELRFGRIDMSSLVDRVKKDANVYVKRKVNMVFTHLNYTNGVINTTDGLRPVSRGTFNGVYVSDQKDYFDKL